MKVIKEGKDLSILIETELQCYKCDCIFTYTTKDRYSTREGTHVACPNETCKAFLSVS